VRRRLGTGIHVRVSFLGAMAADSTRPADPGATRTSSAAARPAVRVPTGPQQGHKVPLVGDFAYEGGAPVEEVPVWGVKYLIWGVDVVLPTKFWREKYGAAAAAADAAADDEAEEEDHEEEEELGAEEERPEGATEPATAEEHKV